MVVAPCPAHREAFPFVLSLALLMAVAPTVAAEPSCALAVTVEGVPQGTALQERLTAIARQEGACSARTWALRVAPGPKGTYVVALWNGTDLETRFANQAEVEPVASVLLRVALERQKQAAPPEASGSAPPPTPTSTPTTSTAPSDGPAPPPAATAPPSEVVVSVGVEAGPTVSNAGLGGEGGVLGFAHGRHLGAGIFGRYGVQGRAAQSRGAFEAGALGAVGTPLGPRVWLGGAFELGLSLQRAEGEADGNTASFAASGATVGGGAIALFTPTPRFQLAARLLGRWSSPAADPAEVTATTAKNNGKGKGVGAGKTVTTTAVDPASQNASQALGGGALSLVLGVGYVF